MGSEAVRGFIPKYWRLVPRHLYGASLATGLGFAMLGMIVCLSCCLLGEEDLTEIPSTVDLVVAIVAALMSCCFGWMNAVGAYSTFKKK